MTNCANSFMKRLLRVARRNFSLRMPLHIMKNLAKCGNFLKKILAFEQKDGEIY